MYALQFTTLLRSSRNKSIEIDIYLRKVGWRYMGSHIRFQYKLFAMDNHRRHDNVHHVVDNCGWHRIDSRVGKRILVDDYTHDTLRWYHKWPCWHMDSRSGC